MKSLRALAELSRDCQEGITHSDCVSESHWCHGSQRCVRWVTRVSRLSETTRGAERSDGARLTTRQPHCGWRDQIINHYFRHFSHACRDLLPRLLSPSQAPAHSVAIIGKHSSVSMAALGRAGLGRTASIGLSSSFGDKGELGEPRLASSSESCAHSIHRRLICMWT